MGKFCKVDGTKLRIYIPSWVKCDFPIKIISHNEDNHLKSRTLLAAVSNDSSKTPVTEFYGIKCKQMEEESLKDLTINVINDIPLQKWKLNKTDHRYAVYAKNKKNFHINQSTELLMITINGHNKIVLPLKLRPYYLHLTHDLNGHFGRDRILKFLQDLWWPGMKDDITNYVNSCKICAHRKGNYTQRNRPNTLHLLRGNKPFDVVYCDFVHMPQSKTGKRYILTMMDSYSRFLYCYATTRDRAIDAAKGLTQFMLEYGIPRILSSDRGTHFTGAVMQELCKDVNIRQNLHCAWRPQSSGNIERCHRVLKNSLYAMTNELSMEWDEALPYVRRSMNIAKNVSTGCSPHFVIFGRESDILSLNPRKTSNMDTYTYGQKVKEILGSTGKMLTLANAEADSHLQARLNPKHVPPDIDVGESVFINTENSANSKRSKLPWSGPFDVLKTNGNVVKIRIDDNKTEWIHRYQCIKQVHRKPDLDCDDMFVNEIFDPHSVKYGERPAANNINSSNVELNLTPVVTSTPKNPQMRKRNMPDPLTDSDSDDFRTPTANSGTEERSRRKRLPPKRLTLNWKHPYYE